MFYRIIASAFILVFSFANISYAAERPYMLSEQILTVPSNIGTPYRDDDVRQKAAWLWHNILTNMGISSTEVKVSRWRDDCQYPTAIDIWGKLKSDPGISSDYLKFWAENQKRVFSYCAEDPKVQEMPIKPENSNFRARAYSDFIYQTASAHFYKSEFDQALTLYKEAAKINSPIKPISTYMVMRTLAQLNKKAEAYNMALDILADPSFKSVHTLAENYRFILMYRDSGTNELALDHLEWLLNILKIKPNDSVDSQLALQNTVDAYYQLNHYFPLYEPKTNEIDWWLKDRENLTPRMNAVYTQASKNEIIDWMQAKWAFNLIDKDWLWVLHHENHPYWQQNENVVNHAWSRFNDGDALEWLEIAITRAHPSNANAQIILDTALRFINQDWENETPEYKEWLYNVWVSSVRLSLGLQDYNQAIELAQKLDLAIDEDMLGEDRYSIYSRENSSKVFSQAIRWLIYTGKFDQAREFLSVAQKSNLYGFNAYQTLLAGNWNEAIKPLLKSGRDNKTLAIEMINAVSTDEMFSLLTNNSVDENIKSQLSLAILTRTMLLGNEEDLEMAALQAVRYNPDLRNNIFSATEENDMDDYISFLLRTPRMRPIPFTIPERVLPKWPRTTALAATDIDVYNHNDNNWWCRVNQNQIHEDIFNTAVIRPKRSWPFKAKDYNEDEFQPYIDAQRAFLSHHPYRQYEDKEEQQALESLPSAPQFLSEYILAKENKWRWKIWQTDKEENKQAADLHYAVRTTRYGCQNDGSHAAYSKQAFDALHTKYKTTIWSDATPYWFSCEHFRAGCN